MKSSWKKQRLATKKRCIKRTRRIKRFYKKFNLKYTGDITEVRKGIYDFVKVR